MSSKRDTFDQSKFKETVKTLSAGYDKAVSNKRSSKTEQNFNKSDNTSKLRSINDMTEEEWNRHYGGMYD